MNTIEIKIQKIKIEYYGCSLSLSLPVCRPLSRWTWVSLYQNVSILDFVADNGDGGGGDNWSYE